MALNPIQRPIFPIYGIICWIHMVLRQPLSLPILQNMHQIPVVGLWLLVQCHKLITCKECLSIHSMLQHITFVYWDGCAFLPPLSTFLSRFPNDFVHHHVPKPVLESL